MNIETTLRVDGFPVAYQPVHYAFHRVHSSVSGVGLNVALALKALGHEVRFLTLLGRDAAGDLARARLAAAGLDGPGVLTSIAETPQSVILYDGTGRREIQVDLKDIQEQSFPVASFEEASEGCALAVLCNINFTRALLAPARAAGLPIATDVHVLGDLDDAYNRDYLAQADILFMSGDGLPAPPPVWVARLRGRFAPRVVVVGSGAEGAWLSTSEQPEAVRIPAVAMRPVVSTIGAGDALFSAYLHGHLCNRAAATALRHAVLFAGHKIGEASAAAGFMTAGELARCAEAHYGEAGAMGLAADVCGR